MRKILALFIVTFSIFIPSISHALIEVDITRGNLNPLPISISPLFSDKTSSELLKELKIGDIGSEIAKVVENNLKQTGLFNPLDKKSFLQNLI